VRGGVRLVTDLGWSSGAKWVTDLGEKKKLYERKEKKTFISRANLSSHTGQPFITHRPTFH